MKQELLTVKRAHLPKVWRARIAAAKDNWLLPDTVVQLVVEAGPRRKIDPNGWTCAQVVGALDLLRNMPRAKTRLSRLRGLHGRLRAAARKEAAAARQAKRAAAEARRPKQLTLGLA